MIQWYVIGLPCRGPKFDSQNECGGVLPSAHHRAHSLKASLRGSKPVTHVQCMYNFSQTLFTTRVAATDDASTLQMNKQRSQLEQHKLNTAYKRLLQRKSNSEHFYLQNLTLNTCKEKTEWVENTTDATTQDFLLQKQAFDEIMAPIYLKLSEPGKHPI